MSGTSALGSQRNCALNSDNSSWHGKLRPFVLFPLTLGGTQASFSAFASSQVCGKKILSVSPGA